MKRITALLYHDFTALDALGPLEVLGRLPGYEIRYASLFGGPVSNEKGLVVMTEALSSPGPGDILLIPGGMGSRQLVLQDDFLAALRKAALASTLVRRCAPVLPWRRQQGFWTGFMPQEIRGPLTGPCPWEKRCSGSGMPAGQGTGSSTLLPACLPE